MCLPVTSCERKEENDNNFQILPCLSYLSTVEQPTPAPSH